MENVRAVIKAIRRRIVELCLAVVFAIYLARPDTKPPPGPANDSVPPNGTTDSSAQAASPCSFVELALRAFLILAAVKVLKLLKGKGGFQLKGTFVFALSFVAAIYFLMQCHDFLFIASLGWAAFLAITFRYV
jgi:hypothetical protein